MTDCLDGTIRHWVGLSPWDSGETRHGKDARTAFSELLLVSCLKVSFFPHAEWG